MDGRNGKGKGTDHSSPPEGGSSEPPRTTPFSRGILTLAGVGGAPAEKEGGSSKCLPRTSAGAARMIFVRAIFFGICF